MATSSTKHRFNGRDSALLVGAMFALAEWPFERSDARSRLTDRLRERAQFLSESVSLRWRTILQEAGLWESPTGKWTRELIEQRGRLENGLHISDSETELLIIALELTELEFSHHWQDFCTVVPGSIDWYGLTPADIARLRRRIEMI